MTGLPEARPINTLAVCCPSGRPSMLIDMFRVGPKAKLTDREMGVGVGVDPAGAGGGSVGETSRMVFSSERGEVAGTLFQGGVGVG